jgi:hypothetical protein
MTRRKLDAYYSPSSVATWLLSNQQVGISTADTILECSVGDGAIARPLQDNGYRVWTNDIDPEVESDYHYDISNPEHWRLLPRLDWIITNPPFNVLNDALPFLFDNCNLGLALFVRKSITEPTFARQEWLKQHEQHLAQIIFCPRVSFTGDGKTDSSSCDWYIWTRESRNAGCKVSWITK